MAEDMKDEPGTKPNPDPTIATNEAVERAMKSERDYVDGKIEVLEERLAGIDRATSLRLGDIVNIPHQIDEKVGSFASVVDERFESIAKQLAIAESQRLEQKQDSKTGLDAALAAQKEAASEQNKSNTLAITKSESATTDTIKKLEDLFTTKTEALADKVVDLASRVDRAEQARATQRETKADTRSGISFAQGLIGSVVVVIVFVLNVIVIVNTRPAEPDAPAVVTVTQP